MKILTSNSPSYIRAEFGSWVYLETLGNAKGEAEANILAKRNGGSYVNLNLDFFKYYFVSFVAFAILIFIAVLVYQIIELPFGLTLISLLFMVAIALVGVGKGVSNTRKRITEEFNMFIQSLAARKD